MSFGGFAAHVARDEVEFFLVFEKGRGDTVRRIGMRPKKFLPPRSLHRNSEQHLLPHQDFIRPQADVGGVEGVFCFEARDDFQFGLFLGWRFVKRTRNRRCGRRANHSRSFLIRC